MSNEWWGQCTSVKRTEKMLPGERFDERVVAAALGLSQVVGRPTRCLADRGLDDGEGSVNSEATGGASGDALIFLMVTGAFGGDLEDGLLLDSSRPKGRSSVDFGRVKLRPPIVLLRGRLAVLEVPGWDRWVEVRGGMGEMSMAS